MSKTLVKKLEGDNWEEIPEEEKKAFRDSLAKNTGETIEFYRSLERRSLERIRYKPHLIGYSPA